ncbi:MAG: hypothetical protein HPY83_09500 [Anaerolineae bacterium]|nr:hypothetical protein [Anaerolineae bacterium]
MSQSSSSRRCLHSALSLVLLLSCLSPIHVRAGSALPPEPASVASPIAVGRSSPQSVSLEDRARLVGALGHLPLLFIENQGQLDRRVVYYLPGQSATVYFTADGVTFVLQGATPDVPGVATGSAYPRSRRHVVQLDFLGAARVTPAGRERAQTVVSYFRSQLERWHVGVPTYHRVVYSDLWPGIDLAYYGEAGNLKYEFIVRPGGDPSRIRLAYRGATSMHLNETGSLEIATPARTISDQAPLAYQDVGGERRLVEAAYAVDGDGLSFGFTLGPYDRSTTLVLDPELLYCGFLGGSDSDEGYDIAVDAEGAAYVVGNTQSHQDSFPVVVGPDSTFNGGWVDVFVAKVNPEGTALEYCGYIGGALRDAYSGDLGIAVDSHGAAYVTGVTESTEASFPVLVGPDLTHNGGADAFVAKVNPAGTALEYCGYIGGLQEDSPAGIAVDSSGAAYVVGTTTSDHNSFPVQAGPFLTYKGDGDVFVAKVRPDGSSLEYCGYIGGSVVDRIVGTGRDEGNAIAVDASGAAYITGRTRSTQVSFPVLVGPDLTFNGGFWDFNAFVAKVRPDGTGLVYCGYLGGFAGQGIAVDALGAAYVTGTTGAGNLPLLVGPDLTFNGAEDAFVAKVRPDGTGLVYSGYVGGTDMDSGTDIAVDSQGAAYVTGYTSSSEATFPVREGPTLTFGGDSDAFVAKVRPDGTELQYCGYVGSAATDLGKGVAVDSQGNAYLTGFTYYTVPDFEEYPIDTFPETVGPDLTFNGSYDAFVAKIGEPSTNGDTTPPAAIADLTAATGPVAGTIVLHWTAPGDDGTAGTATAYQVRYGSSVITEADWGTATPVSHGIPIPADAGTPQSMTVTGLTSGRTYYFAIKTLDEVPNVSAISNSPGATVAWENGHRILVPLCMRRS